MSTSQQRGHGWQHGHPFAPLINSSVQERELLEVKIEALGQIMSERDKQYDARFRAAEIAVNAALAAQEKAVAAAFLASEKAIVKAETAQHDYNDRSNEFRGQLGDQARELMPRAETTALLKNVEEKLANLRTAMDKADEANAVDIKSLRESRAGGEATSSSTREFWGYLLVAAGIVVALTRFLPLPH